MSTRSKSRCGVALPRYADIDLLLTGDLEEPGLGQVLSLPPCPVDVLVETIEHFLGSCRRSAAAS